MSDPSAQGEMNGTAVPAPEAQSNIQPVTEVPAGVQKRFDEMTAKYHQLAATTEATQRQNQELMAMLAQRQTPVETAPPVEVDPALKAQMDAVFAPQLQAFHQQNTMLNQELQRMKFQQLMGGVQPQIAQRAQEYLNMWQSQGKTGWTPADAIQFATGEAVRNGTYTAPPTDGRAQFNQVGAPLGYQGMAPVSQAPAAKLPADFDNWSETNKAAYWLEKSGDQPL